MNVRRRSMQPTTGSKRTKNAGSGFGGGQDAKPIKNAVAMQPKAVAVAVPRNANPKKG